MIPRYQTRLMREIWSEENKFRLWLEVELAVLSARAELGELTQAAYEGIKRQAKNRFAEIDIAVEVEKSEKELQHDLLAFVGVIQSGLEPELKGLFHQQMTSYDTEEIPFVLRVIESISAVQVILAELIEVIIRQAVKYRETLCMGKTHGQHAEVITFGLRLLGFADFLLRDADRLRAAKARMAVGRLAGAVGIYGNLSPEIEKRVCRRFNLRPARHSTQILHRDRLAEVANALALLVTNLEHIAKTLWLSARSDTGEIREPFGQKQKGSSRMPHKRNPIVLERLIGMARMARGRAATILESVPTAEERDISQSSVERVEVPDLFHLVHYMLEKLALVIGEMEVLPEAMLKNINKTNGVIFSPRVKDLLADWRVDPEAAYRLLQRLAFQALEENRTLLELLLADEEIQKLLANDPARRQKALTDCFDPNADLKHLPEIFGRFHQVKKYLKMKPA